MALALAAVVCVAVTSNQMGAVEMEEEQLHSRTSFSVADAILKSADVHDKKGSIPASIAALAAQAAREKETGQLTATVELPQIPKKIAAMAAEAKHEILIERSVGDCPCAPACPMGMRTGMVQGWCGRRVATWIER